MADATERKEFYKQNRDRVLSSQEARDVLTGDALNRVLEELLNANFSESVVLLRKVEKTILVDVIRHIPFCPAKRANNSRWTDSSLTTGTWIGRELQDPQCRSGKEGLRTPQLDKALEQAIDGKMQIPTIEEVEARAEDLFLRLNEAVEPSNHRLYIEGKERLTELKSTVRTPEDIGDRAGRSVKSTNIRENDNQRSEKTS